MNQNKVSDYENKLNLEIKNRLNEIETQGYIFPKRFEKRDYIFTFIVAAFCLAVLIIGAFL